MPEQTQFRNALHGYNREDVVAFIDRMTREHEEDLRRLQEKNSQLRAQLDQANEALAQAGEQEDLSRELDLAKEQISQLLTQKQELETRVEELENALAQAPEEAEPEMEIPAVAQELSQPIPPVPEVLPVEVAPSKDYTELELAAYRRAELAERLARERASDVYRQVQSVFQQANGKIDTGKSDLEQLSKTIREDVGQLLNLLNNIHAAYDEAEVRFAEVNERNRQLMEGEA